MSTSLSPAPRVVIFAGPNGADKSTHADALLAALGIETVVNADYIARGLSGRNTDSVAFEAGRIMLKRLHQLSEAKADFAFESTLSSRTFAVFFAYPQAARLCDRHLLLLLGHRPTRGAPCQTARFAGRS